MERLIRCRAPFNPKKDETIKVIKLLRYASHGTTTKAPMMGRSMGSIAKQLYSTQ